ncbi:MAG: hypothetical protein LH632_05080 [Rhodoferax sp.]|nr:hypothetical protein [Rhodoferax sp.]
MELEIYSAFVKAGVPESDARAAAESINKEIDKRYAVHAQQLATRGDVESVRKEVAEAEIRLTPSITEVQKSIVDMQRRTIAAVFGGMVAFAAIQKLL